MKSHSEKVVGKGSDENLYEYRQKKSRKRLIRRITAPIAATVMALFLLLMVLAFGFKIRSIEVSGASSYTADEILENSGILLGDNILSVSSKEVERSVKKELPFIKSVSVKKQYPAGLVLEITEEYTTFCCDVEGEFFIFNRDLRLMEKYDSLEALLKVRESIIVEMPLPKSCIVPQYMQMGDEHTYVSEAIFALSESPLVEHVTYFDLRDKYAIRLHCSQNVIVELGDMHDLESKFSTLLSLLGENKSKMSGTVDLSCYPRCFYSLKEEYS